MRKIINSKTKQYETVSTDEWTLDDEPIEGSFNSVTSDSVAKAIGNLGKPLQWKGPATVAELNAGITGIQPGWTYTLTDAGTLTDGGIEVDAGDEVAWTEDGEWFKVGGDSSKIAVFTGEYNPGADPADYSGLPDQADVLAAIDAGKDVVLYLKPASTAPYFPWRLAQAFEYGNVFVKYEVPGVDAWGLIDYYALNLSYAGPGNPWTWSRANSKLGKVTIFTYLNSYQPALSDLQDARDNGKAVFLVCGEDVQVGPYWLEKGTVLSLVFDTGRPGYSSHSMEFMCTGVFKGGDCVTVRCVVNGDDTWEWHSCDTGAVKNGGALTDAASVNVPNNALSTLSTAQATLTLNVNVASGEVPNFAVEITPSVDVTLTVTKTVGNTATTLSPSVSGGNSLTTGKMYQVTCVGSCWTLAEFTVPTP